MTAKLTEKRKDVMRASVLDPRRGWHVVPHFDSDFAPCHCVTHELEHVAATSVEWKGAEGRYWLRCLNCGVKWSRAMGARGEGYYLVLDSSHPEERAARGLP